MAVKQLSFGDEAREKIRRGVDTLAEAVKVTLGPRGRTVILQRDFGAPQIVNSGVLVAKSIELADPFENMGAQLLREVAARTSEMAGDGTTTATVLAHAMIHEGLRYLAGGMNPMDLKRGMEQAIEAVVAELKRIARPCASSQEIAHVASISANNDRSIGELLAQRHRQGRPRGRDLDRGRLGAGQRAGSGRGPAVRPRLPVAVLHQQRRTAERGAGRRGDPAVRAKAVVAEGSAAAARRGGQGRPPLAGDRRGRRQRCAGGTGHQHHTRHAQDLCRQGAGLRRPPQGHAAGHRGADRRPRGQRGDRPGAGQGHAGRHGPRAAHRGRQGPHAR